MNRFLDLALEDLRLDEELKTLLGLQLDEDFSQDRLLTPASNNDDDRGGSSFLVPNSGHTYLEIDPHQSRK